MSKKATRAVFSAVVVMGAFTMLLYTTVSQGAQYYKHVDEVMNSPEQWYGKQMQLLDAGKVKEWADTFTEDGVFDTAGIPEPVRGRANIAVGAGRVADQYAEAGIARRHWIGMLTVEIRDGWVYTRSYALVLEIPRGGEVIARRSTIGMRRAMNPCMTTWPL